MSLSCDERTSFTNGADPGHHNGTVPTLAVAPAGSQPESKTYYRSRRHHPPVMVEARVYWWQTDERRVACVDNQFGILPAIPVRFSCIGTLTPKYPKRYRVDLAQALDKLPELNKRELKLLGASLAAAISKELDVEVAPFNGDVINLSLGVEDQ